MTYEEWRDSLTAEQSYDFDNEGRGYKKDRSIMMRLAWEAATKAEREACAKVCDTEKADADETDSPAWADCCTMLAKNIRAR